MYLLDTNIFLELLLNQERADECEKLLQNLHNGKLKGYVSAFALHSIEVILEREGKQAALMAFLQDISESNNLKRFDTATFEEIEALKLAQKLKLDFDDAIQYYICKSFRLKLVSFDKHFDNTDLKRIEPIEIINDLYFKI
ncbi:MAG: type II toxin-antitoxin system VapC family toxin [Candidatus Schekmanbacteria bacterium]|nr:type II toxin-antitoxin system VapC family toxin [Candidatus Schekmanbacteria bacterium]